MDFDILFIAAIVPLVLLLLVDFYWLFRVVFRILRKREGESSAASESKKDFSIWRFIWNFRLLWLNMAVPVFCGAILAGAYSPAPRIESSYPEWESTWDTYSRPIEIVFNVPVQKSALRPFLSNTELAGEWVYEPYMGVNALTRVAKFYPETTLPPDRRLVVYMTGVKRFGVDEYHEHPLNLFTHKAPEVFYATPGHRSTEVATDTAIRFELNKPHEGLSEITFEIEPNIEFDIDTQDEKVYVIRPRRELAQSETYNISVYRAAITRNRISQEITERENPEKIHEIEFSTVKAPLVDRFTPSGTGVKIDSPITIEFEIPMSRDSVESMLTIAPAFSYTFSWESDTKLRIIPDQDLPKETRYTLSFAPGVMSQSGGKSEIAIEHSFTTIGAVRVSEFTPKQNTVRVQRNSNITVRFDQEVDKASAQERFTVSPGLNGTFSWQDNTMTFNPAGLMQFNTRYTATVRTGVKTIDGLDSNQDFSVSFTTVPNQTIVAGFGPEDWDRQDYNFSCGVAALKMGLTWKGVNTSEDALIGGVIPQYTQPMTGTCGAGGGTCTWADPNKYFVGLGNGSGTYGPGQSAYGVHWQPVINAYANYGVTTELRRNWNTTGLAQELNAGHPVQIWWWNGVSSYYGTQGGRRIDWIDVETGNPVEAIHGMHSILVVGFNGDPTSPTSFIVLDPWWGYQTYSLDKFNAQWPKLQNTGVIIY